MKRQEDLPINEFLLEYKKKRQGLIKDLRKQMEDKEITKIEEKQRDQCIENESIQVMNEMAKKNEENLIRKKQEAITISKTEIDRANKIRELKKVCVYLLIRKKMKLESKKRNK